VGVQFAELESLSDVCERVGAVPIPVDLTDRIGLSRAARGQVPVHGLRIAPKAGVSGWYVWAGDRTDDPDFFEPTHVGHIPEVCPLAWPFLALPPGWRFLTDGDYVDVWFDETLLGG
jgi:hypothetical protein